MSTASPRVDEYLNDRMDAPHLSPHLTIEKPILPSLTIWVRSDGQEARLQRWYDVTPDVLNSVGIRSLDFVPDGVVRLIDKNGHEVHRLKTKLTDELDGLPLLLARIEKINMDNGVRSCNPTNDLIVACYVSTPAVTISRSSLSSHLPW